RAALEGGGGLDGAPARGRDRRARRSRRLARAPPAHVPGDPGPGAAVVRREPLHLQHGQPVRGQAADRRAGPGTRPRALHRSDAAGARADRDRDRLRDDRALPRGAARLARPERDRPRRREARRAVSASLPHLLVVPVVLPLLAAVALLLLGDRRRRIQSLVDVGATAAGLLVALEILRRVDADGTPGSIGVYLAANWEAPFGIVLVADRLTAVLLVLTAVVGLAAATYASAGWSRAGGDFHPLFQLQLMGLNGVFLTGDLFNLFVFFEVTLAASYGLLLHGSGLARVRSGLHYIAVNLLASSLFLVGLALLYGVTGTLSMADVALKLPVVPAADRGLLHTGAALLGVAFLTKAAIWPLGFWLVPAYRAASAPVAALFALMTKVGVYAVLRLSTLCLSAAAGPSAGFGAPLLVYAGLATGFFGVLGLLGSLRLGHIAGFSILVSAGTLLAAVGVGVAPVTSTALYYLLSATLAASAL